MVLTTEENIALNSLLALDLQAFGITATSLSQVDGTAEGVHRNGDNQTINSHESSRS